METGEKIVILTGAGISAESGLGTFRDKNGVWTKVDLREVATPDGFARDPTKVHDFYNARRQSAAKARPNEAHKALARLQKDYPGEVVIVTQNVDDLHEQSGAVAFHMHGALNRAVCAACGARWDAPSVMHAADPCQFCGAQATRPDVVWFGEMPAHLDEFASHLTSAKVFAAIGTSGQVYPAAGFVSKAAAHGSTTVEINLMKSGISHLFDRHLPGPATQSVAAWVRELIGT